MKISMISEHASPLAALGGVDAGGQNVHVAALSAALADRGHDVTVFTRRDDRALAESVTARVGVRVVHISAGPSTRIPKDDFLPFMPEFGNAIADFWRSHPECLPEVVHSHFWMSGIAGRIALDLADLATIPLVHTFHALGTVKRRYQGVADTSPSERAVLEPWVGQTADHIIATCSDEVQELIQIGISETKTTIIPCGVDLSTFTPTGPAEDTGGHPRIVAIGRLVPRKGMEVAVRALPLLVAAGYPDIELHIVGGGATGKELETDAEAQRLVAIAQALGVADRLVLRGHIPREEVPQLLRSATMVACTPWYEPFGIVPLEAMACGIPVLAAKVGGLADTVVDEGTGLHIPPKDPEAFAVAAQRLLADPELAAELGQAGVRRAASNYAWPKIAARTEQTYSQLVRPVSVDTAGRRNGVVPLQSTTRRTTTSPSHVHAEEVDEHLSGVTEAVVSLQQQTESLANWGSTLAHRLRSGARLFTAGNGGSAAEAQHLSAELVGRFNGERDPFSAVALTSDSAAVTAISNDYGFEEVFARQLRGHARRGDIVLLLSTSGSSKNLLRAAEAAKQTGVEVWALTGPTPNPLAELADQTVAISAPSPHVQEAHLIAIHAVCQAFDSAIAKPADSPRYQEA